MTGFRLRAALAACALITAAGAAPAAAIAGPAQPLLTSGATQSSSPTDPVQLGGKGYFFVTTKRGSSDVNPSRQLFVTNGTAKGTRQVADMTTLSSGVPHELTVAGGRLYFLESPIADGLTPMRAPELWSTDGASAPVRVWAPPAGTDPFSGSTDIVGATDDALFFTTTPGGTPLADSSVMRLETKTGAVTRIGGSDGWINRAAVASDDSVVYTVYRDGQSEVRHLAADGTDVQLFAPGTADASTIPVAAGNRFYFTVGNGSAQQRLLVSDGTPAGTRDLPGVSATRVAGLAAFQDELVFSAGADGQQDLWITRPGAGPLRLTSGGALGNGGGIRTTPDAIWVKDGKNRLITSRGTAASTHRVAAPALYALAAGYAPTADRTLVNVDDDHHGSELWVVGRGAAPHLLIDLNVQASDLVTSSDVSGAFGARLGSRVLFSARVGGRQRVYVSDGTRRGTKVAFRGTPGAASAVTTVSRHALALTSFEHGLWWSDGTTRGSHPVRPRGWPKRTPFPAGGLVAVGKRIVFDTGSESESELWVSDGTTRGTRKLIDLPQPADPRGAPNLDLAPSDGRAYFNRFDAPGGPPRLWSTDGTRAGTHAEDFGGVANPYPGRFSSGPGRLLFSLGTDAQTQLFAPGPKGRLALRATAPGYVTATADGPDGSLYVISSVNGGPCVLSRFAGGAIQEVLRTDASPFGASLLRSGDSVYAAFGSLPYTGPASLWKVDGTAPTLLRRFAGEQAPASLTRFDGKVLFSADDGTTGTELWQTDGTAAGTRLTEDVNPGKEASRPSSLTAAPKGLLFTAQTPTGAALLGLPRD